MKQKIILWSGITLAVTIFIFYQSLQPADISDGYSRGVLGAVRDVLAYIPLLDGLTNHIIRKMAHFFEFFVQSLLLCSVIFLIAPRWKIYLGYVCFFGLLTAVIDENIQLFSLGRSGMVQDVLLDFSGTVLGIFAFFIFRWFYRETKG